MPYTRKSYEAVRMNWRLRNALLLTTAFSSAASANVGASIEAEASAVEAAAEEDKTIVVTAERITGTLDTDVPPTLVLNDAEITSLGASSVPDLLAALGPQTRSGGGRGSGFPIVLLNGRRVSGFTELRDLPPEAIQRVEVFPEEAAIKLGYSADQRVVNFILKPGFKATTREVEYGEPTAGGRGELEFQTSILRVTKGGRINFNVQSNQGGAITEDERGIVQPGSNDAAFRTLLPKSKTLGLNGVYNKAWKNGVGATINLRYDRGRSDSLLGLIAGSSSDPVNRRDTNNAARAGLTLDGSIDRWQWVLTANLDRINALSRTDRGLGSTERDFGKSQITTYGALYSITGSPLLLPAGRVTVSTRFGFDQQDFTSESITATGTRLGDNKRGSGSGRVNIDIPFASRKEGVAQPLGDLSINGNFGYRHLTDFGGLYNYGYGLTWSPIKGVSASASFTAEDAAPSPQQLGDPIITTRNVTVFDFVRGETVLSQITRGGNPLLTADERRDIKLGLSFAPKDSLSFETNYFRIRSENPISSFPSLGPSIEAAFPGRVIRDGSGRLISVDQRAVNFAQTKSDTLRWGFQFSKAFKVSPGGPMGGRPGGPGAAANSGAAAAGGAPSGGGAGTAPGPQRPAGGPPGGMGRPGGGRGGGIGQAMMGMMGGQTGGRWFVSFYHNLKLKDEARLSSTLPTLNLLRGDALSLTGGSARHNVDVEGGWFYDGIGLRLSGNWRSATKVITGTSPALAFDDLATFSLRTFINMDQRKSVIKAIPFLKGSRFAIRLLNITGAVQKVRDADGLVPFRLQPGYLDPLGRTWEISFRKLF
jgi:iron complex outermembrane recepter protein